MPTEPQSQLAPSETARHADALQAAPANPWRRFRRQRGWAQALIWLLLGGVVVSIVAFASSLGTVFLGNKSTDLPVTDDFSAGCSWPTGENDGHFSYGCSDGAYRLTLKGKGINGCHVTQTFGSGAMAVSSEADAAVTSGLGTQPGNAMLGIGCLTSESHGYVAAIGTDGTW